MRTTWRVTSVTAIEGQTLADLVQVAWFRKNPAHTAMMAEYNALVEEHGQVEADRITEEQEPQEWIDEFLDAVPGEEGAEFIEEVNGTKRLTLDITEGLDLKPGDNVVMTLDVLERVPS